MSEIYDVNNEFLDVYEGMQAIQSTLNVMMAYYDVDKDTEIYHLLLVLSVSVKGLIGDMSVALSKMDRLALKHSK